MSLNDTVAAERVHISFFGLRNAGKSSLVNAVTGQALSIVSDAAGTTTDPVKKAMELLPLGPVLITDTPGIDDEGALGALRVKKAKDTLSRTDIAVLVTDATRPRSEIEEELLALFKARRLPYLIALNKADLLKNRPKPQPDEICVSALTGENVAALKERLAAFALENKKEKTLLSGLVAPGDRVILVVPIDAAAPKGRLILPQQQTLRELLDAHCTALVCQPEELEQTINALTAPPSLIITDSQVFGKVSAIVPPALKLTSFSILFARYKGDLPRLLRGADRLGSLKTGEKVLIAEGCTHHRQCGDIGTEKLPKWIREYSGAQPDFTFCSGTEFPDDLSDYALVVHCGACMLNETEMRARLEKAQAVNVPMVNYGIAIAAMHHTLERSVAPLQEAGDLPEGDRQ